MSHPGVSACFVAAAVEPPDGHAAYLAADGLGQFVDEFYHARIFIRCCHTLDVLLQFLDQFGTAAVAVFGRHHHGGLDELSADRVGDARDGTCKS